MSVHKVSSKKKGGWITWTIILATLFCGIVIASLCVVRYSIRNGVSTARESFQSSFQDTKEETYNQYHDLAFQYAEAEHHVSNDIAISVRTVKEKSSLEVLHVSDVVYIITDGKESKTGTTAWLKVSGAGVFTVNLAAAEYVVDNERQYVLVRVPRPELNAEKISIDSFETLYFKENVWSSSNSVKSGEKLAQSQLSEARQRIQEDFEENEQYSKVAEESAKQMISALIKGINPDIENLAVEVEFY